MSRYRFGDFEFDGESRELRRGGRPIRLRPQAGRALSTLLRSSDHLVTREELKGASWGSTIVEWKAGLHQVIRQLRRALGDDPRHPRFIETVPTRGYRFRGATKLSARPSAPSRVGPSYRDAVFFALGVLSLPALILLACTLFAV